MSACIFCTLDFPRSELVLAWCLLSLQWASTLVQPNRHRFSNRWFVIPLLIWTVGHSAMLALNSVSSSGAGRVRRLAQLPSCHCERQFWCHSQRISIGMQWLFNLTVPRVFFDARSAVRLSLRSLAYSSPALYVREYHFC